MVEFDEKFAVELVECRRTFKFSSITELLAVPINDEVWDDLSKLLYEHLLVLSDVENRYKLLYKKMKQ